MPMLKIAVAVVAVAAAGCALFYREGDVNSAEAHRLVDKGALLVDVRSVEEFADGHIAGAINLPVNDLDRRMGELTPKDRSIVLYCRSGNRSARAARTLKNAGYSQVRDLGAMSRW